MSEKKKVKMIHVRVKSGSFLKPGNSDIDPKHFCVVEFNEDYYAIWKDMYPDDADQKKLIRLVRRVDVLES